MDKTMNKNDLFRRLTSKISIENCQPCKTSLSVAMIKFKENKPFKLEFIPDANCHGTVTHWHVDFIYKQ